MAACARCRRRAPFTALARDVFITAEGMSAEPVAHHRDGACPGLAVVSRGGELHDRERNGRHRHFHLQRIGHQPVHFTGVLYPWRDLAKAACVAVADLHEVDEPRADHGAMAPGVEHVGHRKRLGVGLEQAHPFADGLQHAELDAVVHELGEVPRARRARMHIAAVDSEALQDRLDEGHRLRVTSDHEARAEACALDAPRSADVDQRDPLRAQPCGASH
jgi:hypothetical protein